MSGVHQIGSAPLSLFVDKQDEVSTERTRSPFRKLGEDGNEVALIGVGRGHECSSHNPTATNSAIEIACVFPVRAWRGDGPCPHTLKRLSRAISFCSRRGEPFRSFQRLRRAWRAGAARECQPCACCRCSSASSLSVHPDESSNSRRLKSSRAMLYRFQPSTWARTATIFLRWSCSFAGPPKSTPMMVSTPVMLLMVTLPRSQNVLGRAQPNDGFRGPRLHPVGAEQFGLLQDGRLGTWRGRVGQV